MLKIKPRSHNIKREQHKNIQTVKLNSAPADLLLQYLGLLTAEFHNFWHIGYTVRNLQLEDVQLARLTRFV